MVGRRVGQYQGGAHMIDLVLKVEATALEFASGKVSPNMGWVCSCCDVT